MSSPMLASDPAKAAVIRIGNRAPEAASDIGRISTAVSESTFPSALRSGWTHCAPLPAVATSNCAKEKGVKNTGGWSSPRVRSLASAATPTTSNMRDSSRPMAISSPMGVAQRLDPLRAIAGGGDEQLCEGKRGEEYGRVVFTPFSFAQLL